MAGMSGRTSCSTANTTSPAIASFTSVPIELTSSVLELDASHGIALGRVAICQTSPGYFRFHSTSSATVKACMLVGHEAGTELETTDSQNMERL
jgi:hypothetical protein